jgi:hypothetical protein
MLPTAAGGGARCWRHVPHSPVQGGLVGGKVQGIKSVVAREAAIQVCRRGAPGLPQWPGSSVDGHGTASLHMGGKLKLEGRKKYGDIARSALESLWFGRKKVVE